MEQFPLPTQMGFPGCGLAGYLCRNSAKWCEDSKGLAVFVSNDAC